MEVALVLVSIGLVICLGVLFFGSKKGELPVAADGRTALDSETRARRDAESELEKKRRELEEQKSALAEVKGQLKEAKRKLYDQKESEKGDKDLVKARAEAERSASMQLENVRAELAAAYALIEKNKAEAGRGPRQPRPPAPVEGYVAPVAAAPAEPRREEPREIREPREPREKEVPKRFRELTEVDRERMMHLESEANKSRGKAAEAERESQKLKARLDSQKRGFTDAKSELELVKDKFKALEKRLNRTLLQNDLFRRAIGDLEKKTGVRAEESQATSEQIAETDRQTEASQHAEAKAQADRQAAAEKAAADQLAAAEKASAEQHAAAEKVAAEQQAAADKSAPEAAAPPPSGTTPV